MFVTDTVDAVYPPDNWLPQAIMDRLGEILAPARANGEGDAPGTDPAVSQWAASRVQPRQPLLTKKRIESISDLQRFFSSVSLAAYESVYHSGGKVDWDAVETGLMGELFDGE